MNPADNVALKQGEFIQYCAGCDFVGPLNTYLGYRCFVCYSTCKKWEHLWMAVKVGNKTVHVIRWVISNTKSDSLQVGDTCSDCGEQLSTCLYCGGFPETMQSGICCESYQYSNKAAPCKCTIIYQPEEDTHANRS